MDRTCGSVSGGWTRIASLDINDTSTQCPSGLYLHYMLLLVHEYALIFLKDVTMKYTRYVLLSRKCVAE